MSDCMMEFDKAGPVVLETLKSACSQDPNVIKPAEKQLKEWETQPGFYSTLLAICTDHAIDSNIRFIAVLCFKNGVDRYWRRHAPNGLKEDEKVFLRQKLATLFNEPTNQIATQISVLTAKIARLDCPREWPDLLPVLLQTIQKDDVLIQNRALLTLYYVVKALASRRLATDRATFEEFSANVFSFVLTLWENHINSFFSAVQTPGSSGTGVYLDHAILALKVLRKLVTYGLKNIEQSDIAMHFMNQVFQKLEDFLQAKKVICEKDRDLPLKREKTITLLTKVLLDVQEHHPEAFVQYITASLQLVCKYVFTTSVDVIQDLVFERFTINMTNLMRTILRCEVYRPAKKIEDTKHAITLKAHEIKSAFFTPDKLKEICVTLVGTYMLLSPQELQSWDTDPEDFLCDEGGDSWKFSLRPCMENLFQTLMKSYRDRVSSVVVELVQLIPPGIDPNDLQSIRMKDAVYNAVGLTAFDLFDDIDFDNWFGTLLVPQLENNTGNSNLRIMRRRVIWLIGSWIGVKFSPSLQPVLYGVILPLLQDSDLVVRMEAAITLKIAIDDFEFKTEHFKPYLETCFGLLFKLLQDVSECETKMQILHVMSCMIERMQIEIRPHVGALVQYLPMLWEQSTEHNMLRCAILCTLTSLVQGLGPVCINLFDFLVPVIQLSTDVNQQPHIYLSEDGLELWYNTMLATPSLTPPLLDLYSNMSTVLELGSEILQTALKITEAYVVLAPQEFLAKYSDRLVRDLTSLLLDLKAEGAVMVYKLLEIIFKTVPTEGPKIFSSMLPDIFRAFVDSQDYPMVTSMYICLFSRIILQCEQCFWELIDQIALNLGKQKSEVLHVFIDTWLEKLDNINQSDRKKLTVMALATLLKSNSPIILERFGGIINACVETLYDVYRYDPECEIEQQLDCLVLGTEEPLPTDEIETEHDKRKRQLSFRDPVHSVNLCSYLGHHIRQLQQQQGEQNFKRLVQLVDTDVLTQLHRFLK